MTTVTETLFNSNFSELISMEFNSTTKEDLIKTNINYYGLIYTAFLFVIGIPGNLTVFIVYSKKQRKNSTTIFILVLAVFDLINCIATLPTEIVMLLNPFVFHIGPVCKMSRFTTYTCNSAAAVVLAAIAVDRYKRVCRPHGKQITAVWAKRMAFVALTISASFTWPSLIIYGPRTVLVHTDNRNFTLKFCEIADVFVTTAYPMIYYSYMCISTCGIYFILLTSYICIVVRMVKRRKFSSLISARSASTREVPDIHIEHPTSQAHHSNAIQVTSLHSSTRSLNVCCRTDESNCFQYEPASSVKNKIENVTANELHIQPNHSSELKPNGFLNVSGQPIHVKEYVFEHKEDCNTNRNNGEPYETANLNGGNQQPNGANLSKKGTSNSTYCVQPISNGTIQIQSDTHFLNPINVESNLPRGSESKDTRCSSQDIKEYSSQNVDINNKLRKSIISQTPSNTGELTQNGSSKSKMRPSKRSLRTLRLGKTTLMLLVVTMIYIVSFLPFLGVVIQRSIDPLTPLIYKGDFDTVYEALYRSYLLNCAVNPVIYSFCNANFRKDCRAACRRRKLFYR